MSASGAPAFASDAIRPAASRRRWRLLAWVSVIVIATSSAYLGVRLVFSLREADWRTLLFTAILIAGESFFILHGFSYSLNLLRGSRHPGIRPAALAESDLPPVAVLISCYNEPVEVVRATLEAATRLDYPRRQIYLLDDSSDEATVAALEAECERLGALLLHRRERRGYKAGALNDALAVADEPFLMLLDADQRPDPGFLRGAISRLLPRTDAAFIQTPQTYDNTGGSLVAFAAEVQQTPFYDFGCVGKDAANAAFYVGTNCVLRREAVLSAGGFAEDSVTEDLVTSYRMHRVGWRSGYHPRVAVRGVGPPNLLAYFNQQYRWAYGTFRFAPEWRRGRGAGSKLTRVQQLEYFLTISWWLQAWSLVALLLLPPAFFLLGARIVGPDLWFYAAAFVPYAVLANLTGVLTLGSRGYSGRGVLLGQALTMVAFPVYMKALVDALRGKRTPFKVTGKKEGLVYVRFRLLAPQLVVLSLNLSALALGAWSLLRETLAALLLVLVLLLAIAGIWEFLMRARELQPLRIAWQRAAWRTFQVCAVTFAVATAAVLFLVDLAYGSTPLPERLAALVSTWAMGLDRAAASPDMLLCTIWAWHNTLFLYGTFMFRVGTRQ
jgi:cellulose synthase (UDP-forming)